MRDLHCFVMASDKDRDDFRPENAAGFYNLWPSPWKPSGHWSMCTASQRFTRWGRWNGIPFLLVSQLERGKDTPLSYCCMQGKPPISFSRGWTRGRNSFYLQHERIERFPFFSPDTIEGCRGRCLWLATFVDPWYTVISSWKEMCISKPSIIKNSPQRVFQPVLEIQ